MSNSRIMMLVVVILLAVAFLFLVSLVLGAKQREMPKLFSVGLQHQAGLDNGNMTLLLKREFLDNSITLSEHVKVSIRTEDSQWQIEDTLDKKKNYIVRKEDGSLNIYSLEKGKYSPGWAGFLGGKLSQLAPKGLRERLD